MAAISTISSSLALRNQVSTSRIDSPNLSFSSSLTYPHPQFRRFSLVSRTTQFRRASRLLPVQAKKQTFSSFDELITESDKPVLVDFYATWCGPCQLMAPILNEVSSSLKDSINVVKIDTEKYPNIANRYKVEALPTFIIFRDGKPYQRFEGALPAAQLIEWVSNSLKVTS